MFSEKTFQTLQKQITHTLWIAMARVDLAMYYSGIFDLVSFPNQFSHFSCKFYADRYNVYSFSYMVALLLKMGSLHQQHGPHMGACLKPESQSPPQRS